jgi:pimeloyl-ACP methyl ester carboxylesterase
MGALHRFGKKIFFGRFMRKWRWPEGVAEAGWERVAFPSGSGARLSGLFGAASSEPVHGAIVLAHPMSAAAKAFWLKHAHADLRRWNGFHVLAFDFNGFGESDSTDFNYPADVLAAGEYLRQRVAPLPIAVLGASFGAGYALCAMAKEHPFRAAVLEAAFPSLPFYWRGYPVPHMLLRISQVVYPRFERDLRPMLAATQLKRNPHILLIHGDADTVAPVHVGEELRAALSGRAEVGLWIAGGADHVLALRAQPEAYAQRVTSFLTGALGQSTDRS